MNGTSMIGGLRLLPCSGTYSALTWQGQGGIKGGLNRVRPKVA